MDFPQSFRKKQPCRCLDLGLQASRLRDNEQSTKAWRFVRAAARNQHKLLNILAPEVVPADNASPSVLLQRHILTSLSLPLIQSTPLHTPMLIQAASVVTPVYSHGPTRWQSLASPSPAPGGPQRRLKVRLGQVHRVYLPSGEGQFLKVSARITRGDPCFRKTLPQDWR